LLVPLVPRPQGVHKEGRDEMALKAQKDDTVKVHYLGTLADGTVFDSSEGRDPLEFVVGSGSVIEGFDRAVIDMEEGQSKEVTIPSDRAYGPWSQELVFSLDREAFPFEPQEGMVVRLSLPSGEDMAATVCAVEDQTVTLDANHPLAGKDLTFKITLVGIQRS